MPKKKLTKNQTFYLSFFTKGKETIMEKTILDKIREVLTENGIEEEVIAKVEGELNTDETNEDEKPVDEVEEDAEQSTEEVLPTEEGDVPPVEESTPPADDIVPEEVDQTQVPTDDVPPTEDLPPVDNGLPEGVEEMQVGEQLPPVEDGLPEEQPPVEQPQFDMTMISDLKNELEETRKANEGLLARVESLESALKQAGVMSETEKKDTEFGIDDGTRTPDYRDDDADFEATLNKFNKGF